MSRIRLLRLENDAADLRAYLTKGAGRYVTIEAQAGQPPSTYDLVLRVPGIAGLQRKGETPPEGHQVRGPFLIRPTHRVRITLGAEYPYRPPLVTFLDSHLHPNIYSNGRLCWGLGDARSWWRGGDGLGIVVERLLQLVVVSPDCVNPRSPAHPDAVRPYLENSVLFPLADLTFSSDPERRTLRFRELSS